MWKVELQQNQELPLESIYLRTTKVMNLKLKTKPLIGLQG